MQLPARPFRIGSQPTETGSYPYGTVTLYVVSRASVRSVFFEGDAMTLEELIRALKAEMPKRDGGHGWGAVPRLIGTYTQESEWSALILGVKNYAAECKRRGKLGSEYVMQAKTFFGRDRHWEEYAEMDMRTPAEIALDKQWTALEARARALGFKEVDRSRGLATVEYAIKAEEDKRRLRVVG